MQKKKIINRFWIGIKKGLITPTLPDNITRFHNNPLVRLFRIIGGLSLIITLGKISLNFNIPSFFYYSSAFISLTFLMYMFVINIFRLIHIIKILKSDKLEVRNSPLDRFATLTARVLLCTKGLCYAGAAGGSVTGFGLGLDAVLINTGNDPVFSPYFLGVLYKILPSGTIRPSQYGVNGVRNSEIKKILNQLDDTQLEQLGLKDLSNSLKSTTALSETEKKELEEIALNHYQDLVNKEAYLKSKVKAEIDKLK